jgi:DNA-binding MarR family transcriptional regulator
MNTYYGTPGELPFNLRHRVVRILYNLQSSASPEELKSERRRLTHLLQREINLVWKSVISGGLTESGLRMAEVFVRQSQLGLKGDPQLSVPALCDLLGVLEAQVRQAIDELEGQGLIRRLAVAGDATRYVSPTPQLFLAFDPIFLPWDPAEDAKKIAEDLVAGPHPESNQVSANQLAKRYGWEPRRLNPALQYLKIYNFIGTSAELNATFAFAAIFETAETRRFVRGQVDI